MSFTLPSSCLHLTFDADSDVSDLFSFTAELKNALRFENALANSQAQFGLIPDNHAAAIAECLDAFEINEQVLAEGVSRDGLYVPALIRQIRHTLPKDVQASFHKDTTSQDVIDTSLMLRMKAASRLISGEIAQLIKALEELKSGIGDRPISARTRMQVALPFTLAGRIELWLTAIVDVNNEKPTEFPLQLGGPIGMMHKSNLQWTELVQAIADELKLSPIETPWHTNRQPLIKLCNWITAITTALGKIGADISLMTQNGIGDLTLEDGGSSSAMPHKNNPVLAEILIAAARFNAGQMGLLHNAALHEQERSGASWTLEFMIAPQMVVTSANALANARRLIMQLR